MLLFPCFSFLSPQPASPKAAVLHKCRLALRGEDLVHVLLYRVEDFFSTLCPTGSVAGKWPFHQFPQSAEECGSTSKAAVAGLGTQAFLGLHKQEPSHGDLEARLSVLL